MFSFFAYPIFFYTLVLVLLVVSLIAVFSMGKENTKSRERRDEEISAGHSRIAELEQKLVRQEQESRAGVQQMEKQFKEKEESYVKQLAQLDEQSKSGEVIKSHLVSLQSQLNAKETAAAQAIAAQQALEQEVSRLRRELENNARELGLANQMYDGLKGQFDEMEEKYAQLFQQFVALQKGQKQAQAAPAADTSVMPGGFKIPNLRAGIADEENTKDPPSRTA
ncbi:MAG: hypothetical protein PHT59_00760 [Candidatus Omnitrophica bacterium]|nr:hypothetical protein [Candidatus Omnitrophota bacterium]